MLEEAFLTPSVHPLPNVVLLRDVVILQNGPRLESSSQLYLPVRSAYQAIEVNHEALRPHSVPVR